MDLKIEKNAGVAAPRLWDSLIEPAKVGAAIICQFGRRNKMIHEQCSLGTATALYTYNINSFSANIPIIMDHRIIKCSKIFSIVTNYVIEIIV